MSNPDLGPILDDLAAGRIDAAEANRRINAIKGETSGGSPTEEPPPKGKPGGLSRVAITAIGRRVRIEGDSKVASVSVDGPHVMRRNGDAMEIKSTGELGPKLSGFSLVQPQKIFDDMGFIGLGKELVVKVNPRLIVDVEATTGRILANDVPRFGRVRVTMGSCQLSDVVEVSDLLSQAGSVTLEGPLSRGQSRVRIESGNLSLVLKPGTNAVVRTESKVGIVRWPEENTGIEEVVYGNGAARVDINVVMGMATIKDETLEEN